MKPSLLPLALPALALVLAPALAGCSTPERREVTRVGLTRETPSKAYGYLKAMVAAGQVEEEWKCFSPGFKRRLSQQAGRTVDVGDYVQARSTIAGNGTREVRQILESELEGERLLSEDVAVVEIRSGRRAASLRFVRLTTVELTLRGEGQPVAEFIPSAADVVSISPTGDVEMSFSPSDGTASYLRDIPRDRIQRLVIQDEWYLDDFGGVGALVAGGIRGESPRPADLPPPPPEPSGSPDAVPVPDAGSGSPDGVGSPDGAPGSPDGG
jgi:hypothetical protein